jgi:PAS domain S-box-containing protein
VFAPVSAYQQHTTTAMADIFKHLPALNFVPSAAETSGPSGTRPRSTNEDLEREIAEGHRAEAALQKSRDELEMSVQERTAELARANEALHKLTDVIPHHIWSSTPDGTIDYCNQRLLEYVGRALDEIQGDRFLETIHPEDRDRLSRLWRTSLSKGTPFTGEWRVRGSDGRYRWFFTRGLPLRDEQGNIIRWYVTNTDVEDAKRAEQALMRMQVELAHVVRVTTMGELAASIAHEVNQPLAAVVTNANASLRWLAAEPPNLVEVRETVNRILRDARRAADVIQRIRTLLKKSVVEPTRQDVNDLVREVLALVKNELFTHRIATRVDLTREAPPVLADRVQLQQVILNLVMNGIEAMNKATDRPRSLLVTSRTLHTGEVAVAVQDNGIGISPAVLDQLFNPFFTTKPGGMGMGLSVCRSIVESYGGRLWAEVNKGPGATFEFALPAAGP